MGTYRRNPDLSLTGFTSPRRPFGLRGDVLKRINNFKYI
nr:MAG TPA: hypothetical protein [Bacteriophage sp.]